MPFPQAWKDVKKRLGPLLTMLPAVGVGGALCLVLAEFLGIHPLDLMAAIWNGAWGGSGQAMASLSKITPLMLSGLAVALAYRVGLLNIGCEGQLTLGALAAASFAVVAAPLPKLFLMPLTVLVGALAGGLWAFPAVWLKQHRGVHEVITTLLLNYVAIYLADYLVRGPLGDGTAMARTPLVPEASIWPAMLQFDALGLTGAPFLALGLCFAAQMWLTRTCWGYEATACGSSALAAKAAGISVSGWQRRMFVSSGAVAGLAGALEIVAVHHRFYAAFSPGYGFDGLTVAFLVNNSPGWLWLSALLLASLRSSDKWLQVTLGISPNAILVIQATLLISVACQFGVAAIRRPGWLSFLSGRAALSERED